MLRRLGINPAQETLGENPLRRDQPRRRGLFTRIARSDDRQVIF